MTKFNFKPLINIAKNAAGEAEQMTKELAALRTERDNVAAAPMAKEDVYGFLCYQLDEEAKKYPSMLFAACKSLYQHPGVAPGEENKQDYDFVARFCYPGNTAAAGLSTQILASSMQSMLCYMFPNEIKTKLKTAIDSIDWSHAGLPRAERLKKISGLNNQIRILEEDIEVLQGELNKIRQSF